MTSVYKIRNRQTGLWSAGGTAPAFNNKGKTWSTIGHVKSHLKQLAMTKELLESLEMVEFEIKYNEHDVDQNLYNQMRYFWASSQLKRKYREFNYLNDVFTNDEILDKTTHIILCKQKKKEILDCVKLIGISEIKIIEGYSYSAILVFSKEDALKLRLALPNVDEFIEKENFLEHMFD